MAPQTLHLHLLEVTRRIREILLKKTGKVYKHLFSVKGSEGIIGIYIVSGGKTEKHVQKINK